MCIIEKVFRYEETDLPIIKYKDEIWIKAVAVATILRYKNTMKSIRDHVDPEDKRKLSELGSKSKQNEMFPLERNEKNTIYINESGLYSSILRSKLESARVFKRWVTKDVLSSIRNTGRYIYDDMNHKYSDSLTFKIENETDLHTEVVSFSKKRYPYSIFTAILGENQDTSKKRIQPHKKGYLRGYPDLIINNLHKHYTGFAIEFKNPKRNGVLSYDQSKMLQKYQNNRFKTLVSNDYDYIIEQLIEYFRDDRIKCSYCSRKYISSLSIKNKKIQVFIKNKKIQYHIYMEIQKVKKEKVRPHF